MTRMEQILIAITIAFWLTICIVTIRNFMAALLLLILVVPLPAESRTAKWVRRGAAIGSCAISGYDALQTDHYVNHVGGYTERSPLGSGKALFTVKAGACILPVVVGERSKSNLIKQSMTAVSVSTGVVFGVSVKHNLSTIRR